MKYSQLMFRSAERRVATDVTVPQAVPAFQFRFLPYATFDALSTVCQRDSNCQTSPYSDAASEAMFTGSQRYLPASDPGSPVPVRVTACPESLMGKHPTSWSKDDVEEWLDWCVREFELDDVQQKKFSMNGKALCILSKEGFRYRAPNAGDFLYELLQKLLKRDDEPTRPAYEPTFRLRTLDKCNRDHSKSSDDGGISNIPELLPLNLKITDNGHESSSSSGHSTPYAVFEDESQYSPRPMAAIHHSYPPYLSSHPTIHPKTLQEPRNGASIPETHPDTPTGQNPRPDIHSPAHCSSPPSRQSPANHSQIVNRKQNFPPYLTSRLPHRQSLTAAGFAAPIEDYKDKHRRETMEAQLSSAEGLQNSSANRSGDARPILRDILTSRGRCPKSVLPYSRMKVQPKVHVPVIQETAAASTNGNTCTRVISNCTANQRSASISSDTLAHHVPPAPFSLQYPYHLAPSVGQALTCERSSPSVFSNMLNVKVLCDTEVEEGTLEMDCDAKQVRVGKKKGHRPLLWQFLWQLLKDRNNLHSICWEDEVCLVFRIIDTEKVSKLWGKEKNRLNMTYEKMSRGMRYYYNTGILCKEPGQKLTYRFLTPPEDLINSRPVFKNKTQTNAVSDAESREARIDQEVDTPKSFSSETDPETAEKMSSPGSASTTSTTSLQCCDTPIGMTTVAREDIKIKREPDDLGFPLQ
ncbi:transcription factor ETV6-like isoform X2 [Asterias amurensis]|uniref:transcription factor ETV6-like isoform X2 n=1 Tax=Asterias amurensis TaxID=7602 RepID=UPI003AB1996E